MNIKLTKSQKTIIAGIAVIGILSYILYKVN